MNKEDFWIQTMSGKSFHPFNPSKEEIVIEDIAHGLSNTCRFGGQCSHFYSVAQHCCLMAELVPRYARFWALMHDAAEAYIGDMPTPIKEGLPEFKQMEDKILDLIIEEFNIPITTHTHSLVKKADRWLCAMEARKLMDRPDWAEEVLATPYFVNPKQITIEEWSPNRAKTTFVLKFVQQKKWSKEYANAC